MELQEMMDGRMSVQIDGDFLLELDRPFPSALKFVERLNDSPSWSILIGLWTWPLFPSPNQRAPFPQKNSLFKTALFILMNKLDSDPGRVISLLCFDWLKEIMMLNTESKSSVSPHILGLFVSFCWWRTRMGGWNSILNHTRCDLIDFNFFMMFFLKKQFPPNLKLSQIRL